MMRATWKGMISFGLVSVPVGLYTASREHNLPLHQVHARDGGRVRMRRVCEKEDVEVSNDEIAKGYDAPDGQVIVLTDDDLAGLPVPSKKTIEVLAFVPGERIDPLSYGKPYYVGPDRAGIRPYVLLRDTMIDSGQVAVTKVTMSTRESLAVLRPHTDGRLLVLQTMLWPDELTTPVDIAPPESVTSRPQELKMARTLMDTLSEDFDLTELQDDYQTALAQLVQARLEGSPAPRGEERPETDATVIDLMTALERSVNQAKTTRDGSAKAKPASRARKPRSATAEKEAAAPARRRRTS